VHAQDCSNAAMLPDMLAALKTTRGLATSCEAAAETNHTKKLEEMVEQAERAVAKTQRMANVVAPNWVGGGAESGACYLSFCAELGL
jgi:hypothetical protein